MKSVSLLQEMTHQASFLFTEWLHVIAPARCMSCLREGTWLCSRCRTEEQLKASLFPQRCIACQRERLRGRTCLACRGDTLFIGSISAGAYNSPSLRRGIHWLKFKGVRDAALPLAQMLMDRLSLIAPLLQLTEEAALVPLPLHRRRLRERGFNQSEEIARHLSVMSHIPMVPILHKRKSTFAQSRLPREVRDGNMANAFVVTTPLPASVRQIILIDDVVTSGATLNAAAHAIHDTYPLPIWALTVARG